jgi:cytochrome c oxidase assembly factor CtaG
MVLRAWLFDRWNIDISFHMVSEAIVAMLVVACLLSLGSNESVAMNAVLQFLLFPKVGSQFSTVVDSHLASYV